MKLTNKHLMLVYIIVISVRKNIFIAIYLEIGFYNF